MQRQFLGIEPNLKGVSKLAYVSQKHNIDAQVKGWEDYFKTQIADTHAMIPPMIPPMIQEEERKKERRRKNKQQTLFILLMNFGKPTTKKQGVLIVSEFTQG